MSFPASERVLRARLAGLTRWANTSNRTAATQACRTAFNKRFEREVDPDGTLPEAERLQRADAARKAYFTRLALKSASSRRKANEARQWAADADEDARSAEVELAAAGEPTLS